MASVDGGSIKVRVIPDATGFVAKVKAEAEKARKAAAVKIDVGVDASSLRRDLNAAVRTARATVKVDAEVDARSLERSLRRATLASSAKVHVGIDLDLAGATARIEAWAASLRPTVHVNIDYDHSIIDRLELALSGLAGSGAQGAGQAANTAAGSFSNLGSTIGVAAAALAGLAAINLVPLIASASQALGVFALLPGVIGAAGGAVATLGLGLGGVVNAFKASGDAATSAGGAAVDAAHDQEQAAQRVTQAQDSVTDAAKAVADAQQDARDAAKDLNDAYKDQARQLEDVNQQLTDAQLNTEDAALGLARAQADLQKTQNDRALGKASDLDVAEDQHRVREAQNRLNKANTDQTRAGQDARDANQKGIEGGDKVVDAKRRLVDATGKETDANRRLRDAQWALNEAYYQQAHATSAASGGVDKYAEAMSKLSPNAQQFVTQIKSLSGAFTDLRNNVQDKLFDGMGQKVSDLAYQYLPTLNKGLGDIASGFNSGLSKIIDQMSKPENVAAWSNIFSNTAVAVDKFLGGLGYLGSALTTIASVGSDFLPGIGQGFETTMQKFDNWIKGLESNGKLKQFIQDAIDKFQELWHIGGQVVDLIKNIFSGGKDSGDDMLKSISNTLDKWNTFLGSDEGQQKLKDFFADVKQAAKDILDTINAAADIVRVIKGVGPRDDGKKDKQPDNADPNKSKGAGANSARLKDKDGNTIDSQGNQAWNPGESGLAATLPVIPKNGIIGKAGRGIAGVVGYSSRDGEDGAGSWDGGLWKQTGERWAKTGDAIKASYDEKIGPTISSFVQGMRDIGSTAVDKVQTVASGAWGFISNAATTAGSTIASAARGVGQWFSDVGTKAGSAKDTVVQKMGDMLNWLGGLGSSIAQKTSGMWDGISEAFKEALNWIIDRWNAFTIKVGGWEIMGKKLPSLTVSMPQIPRLYSGGAVRDPDGRLSGPGNGTSDSILGVNANGVPVVRVSDKETVVTADASAHPGNRQILTAMNQGQRFDLPGLASGGAVQDPNAKSTSTYTPGSEQGKPSGPTSPTGKPSDLTGMMSFLSSMASTALYGLGAFSRTAIDCSGLVSAGINSLFGEDPFVGRMNTTTEGSWLSARGFVPGAGGPNDLTIGYYDEGGGANGHTAGTLPGGTPFEAHGPDGTPIEYGTGQGANQSIFTDFWHLVMAPQDLLAANINVSGGNLPNPNYPGGNANAGSTTDPNANTDYSAADTNTDTPTTISGWAGKLAQSAASDYTQDFLGVVGLPDELPGVVQAAFVTGNAVNTQGNESLSGLAGLAGKATVNSRGAYNAPKNVYVPQSSQDTSQQNQQSYVPGATTPGQAKVEGDASNAPPSPAGVGGLTANSSRDEIASAIIGEGKKRGYSNADIAAILSAGIQESNLDPSASGGGGAWHGIFQQDTSYPGRDDPNQNISAFYDRLDTMRKSQGWSSDMYKNIFWLQQRPGEGSADAAFANGRQAYYSEISSHGAEAQALMQKAGVYDQGGWLYPNQLAVNKTRKPEPVLNEQQWQDVAGILDSVAGPNDKLVPVSNLNQTIADTSAAAMISAASAVPQVGPALSSGVQAGVSAMRTFNAAVESGLGFAQAAHANAQNGLAQSEAVNRTINSHNTTNYTINGTDAQSAMRLARLRENREALAYAGGRS